MKRLTLIPAILALSAGLAACGDDESTADATSGTTEALDTAATEDVDYEALAIDACETAVRADATGQVNFIEVVAPREPTVLDDGARQLPVFGDVDITLGSETSEEGFSCYAVILEENGELRTLDASTGTFMRGSWEDQ